MMTKKEKLLIAGDHAGFELKSKLYSKLSQLYDVQDLGPMTAESCDYPDYAHQLAKSVDEDSSLKGILICGSGNGVAIVANKRQNVRAGLCWTEELAELARSHNNINVLCLPARFIDDASAEAIVNAFLNTPFEGGRHTRRVDKIPVKN